MGDARDTLRQLDGEIDLVLRDGAFSLYLPELKLLEPRLKPGTPILAENAWEHGNAYLDHVRDPANGYPMCAIRPMATCRNRCRSMRGAAMNSRC